MKIKILLVGLLTLILFSSVSGLTVNTTEITESTIELTFEPELNVSTSPDVWLDNKEIKTPIRDKLILTDLEPDTLYHITIYFSNPKSEYFGEYYQILEQTEPSDQIQLDDVVYQYGFILLILVVIGIIAIAKIPFGGIIPLFLSLAGVIHYIKYDGEDSITLLIYMILIVISAYVVYIRER